MARMSVDDSFGRDPRVVRLATLCGWSRRETMGCLFDIWAICYDRITPVLPERDIDIAADLNGFSGHLIGANLGTKVARGVRVSGARVRIKYLKGSEESGREGGIKSGEVRRKKAEANRRDPSKGSEGVGNLSPSVPSPVPASPPSSVPAVPPETRTPTPPLALAEQLRQLRARWCDSKWTEINGHRERIASAYGLAGVRPIAPHDHGRADLRMLILDSDPSATEQAKADAEHVIAVRVAEAESKRTVQWLSGGMFSGRQLQTAMGMTVDDVRKPKTTAAPSRAQSALDAQMERLREAEAEEEAAR